MKKPSLKKRKEISSMINKWRGNLLLDEWYIDVSYIQDDLDNDDCAYTNADITADPVYLRAKIRLFPHFLEETLDVQERVILHELCHCHVQELWNIATKLKEGNLVHGGIISDIAERLTQRIANAVFLNN